jgi:hypothetical protein
VNRDWSGAQDCSDNSQAEGVYDSHDGYSFPPSAKNHKLFPATEFDPSQFHKKLTASRSATSECGEIKSTALLVLIALFAFRSFGEVLSEDKLVTNIFPDSIQNRQCVAASARPRYLGWITIRSRIGASKNRRVVPLHRSP